MTCGTRLRAMALCSLTLLACGGPEKATVDAATPGGAVQVFFQHLNDGHDQEALAMYTDEARQALEDPEVFRSWADQSTRERTIDHVRIGDVALEETSATVEFEIVYQDGVTVQRKVELTGGDGDWKMGLIL